MGMRLPVTTSFAPKDKILHKSLCNRAYFQQWLHFSYSRKTKLLLAFCIVIYLHALAQRASSIMGWHTHPSADDDMQAKRNKFTVLINTWKRNDLLKTSVAHYAGCGHVDSIRIVWSEEETPTYELRSFLLGIVQDKEINPKEPFLWFDVHVNNSLNNRFRPLEGVRTGSVFSVDDDVLVPCSTLKFAFSVWQNAPDSIVGFVPRMHWFNLKKRSYSYGGWWSVWWTGKYSMVLTKAAFLNHKYLELYTNKIPSAIRDYVTDRRNCEDVAMSFLVANLTGAPPIWVKGNVQEIASTGISSLKRHSKQRTNCLNDFVSLYGYMPLVSSTMKAVNAQKEWWW